MKKTVIQASLIGCVGLLLSGCGPEDGEPAGAASSANSEAAWSGVYSLTILPNFWVEPRGIGKDIGTFVPDFLFDVQGSTVTLATSESGAQQMCTPTLTTQAVVSPPEFVLGPVPYQMHLVNEVNQAHVNTIVRNVTFTNVLPPVDAAGGTMSAVLDAREIYPLLHLIPMPTPDALCTALANYDAPCEPCPQDGLPFCITIVAEGLEAVPASDQANAPLDAGSLGPECANAFP
jgi:hypothetical protein